MSYTNDFDEYKFAVHRMLISLGLKDQPATALMKKNQTYIQRCYGSPTYHATNRKNSKTSIVTAEMVARILVDSLSFESPNSCFFEN